MQISWWLLFLHSAKSHKSRFRIIKGSRIRDSVKDNFSLTKFQLHTAYLLFWQVLRIPPRVQSVSFSALFPMPVEWVFGNKFRPSVISRSSQLTIQFKSSKVLSKPKNAYITIATHWNVFKAFLFYRFHQTSIHRPELIEFIWFIISNASEFV